MMTRLYKFLAKDAVGPFSGFGWPTPAGREPGCWVEAHGALEACVNGIHACTTSHLPYWIDDELWAVEVDGETLGLRDVVLARRGRLLERVEAWDVEARHAFADACVERAKAHTAAAPENERAAAYANDAAEVAREAPDVKAVAFTAYAAVQAAGTVTAGGVSSERAWQAAWLADRLGLA